MTESDLNLWGELVVPVGLLICFGPALVVWFFQELKAKPETGSSIRRDDPKH